MKTARPNPIKLVPIRMDTRFIAVLDRKARHAKLSREGFIRQLIERAIRVKSKRRPAAG